MRNGSQRVGYSSSSTKGSPQSSSQGSPLMDSSHSTSASTGIDSGVRSIGRPLGVQASNDDEDSFTVSGRIMLKKDEAQVASIYLA
jgi:hypothetical protein